MDGTSVTLLGFYRRFRLVSPQHVYGWIALYGRKENTDLDSYVKNALILQSSAVLKEEQRLLSAITDKQKRLLSIELSKRHHQNGCIEEQKRYLFATDTFYFITILTQFRFLQT